VLGFPRRWILVAAAAAVVLGIAAGLPVVIRGLLSGAQPRVALFNRPAPGGVSANYLPDGTPIWVITHKDGLTEILSGFDTRVAFGIHELLWWCPTSRSLEDPFDGSRYDEHGVKYGGPAPKSLPGWIAIVQGGDALVGPARPVPPIRLGAGLVTEEPPLPQPCVDTDRVTVHTFNGWQIWESPRELLAAAPTGWVLAEGQLQVVGDSVRFCSIGGCDDSAQVGDVSLPPASLAPLTKEWPDRVWMLRVRNRQFTDLTRIIRRPGSDLPIQVILGRQLMSGD